MSSPSAPSVEQLAALLRAYLAAHYRWCDDGVWHALAIGVPAPALDRLDPDARGFGLLTAWNPASRPRGDAGNRAADRRLRDDLQRTGLRILPTCASAPHARILPMCASAPHARIADDAAGATRSAAWAEPGWLPIGIDRDTCDALARRYGQLGWLWWRRGEPVGLRMDAARPAGIGDDARVRWLGDASR